MTYMNYMYIFNDLLKVSHIFNTSNTMTAREYTFSSFVYSFTLFVNNLFHNNRFERNRISPKDGVIESKSVFMTKKNICKCKCV